MNSQLKLVPKLNTLLTTCTCGSDDCTMYTVHKIDVLACNKCGVMRQHLENYTVEKYAAYYRNDYHTKAQTEAGLIEYKDRYEHDYEIAKQRLAEYIQIMPLRPRDFVLDIGSSNNAFVDYLNDENSFNCKGIEIGEEGKKHPSTTYTDDLLDLNLPSDSYELVTMHDVFEHVVDPVAYLKEAHRILASGKWLVIDLPNYFVEEGLHHWRPVQHLWFFNKSQTMELLEKHGFKVITIKRPIKSKLVFYCEKV